MNFQNDLNMQNKLKLNNSNNNFFVNNNNFIPFIQSTPFPFIETTNPEGKYTNNFQELIRPVPFPLFYFLNNNLFQRNYLSNFNNGLNLNNINIKRNIHNENNIFLPNFITYENKKEDSNKNKNINILQKVEQYNNNNNLILNENEDSNYSLTVKDDDLWAYINNQSANIEKPFNSKNVFLCNKKRKRGRPRRYLHKNINHKIHDCNSLDNILRKIQIHYLSYIISLTNDLIKSFSTSDNLRFKNIDYQIKSYVNYRFVKSLKKMKIKDIFQFKISNKYRIYESEINKKIFQQVSKLFPFLNDFFNMTYLEVFNKFYIKFGKVINFEGKNIYLSENTKIFSDLLEKNKNIAVKIQKIVENIFAEKDKKNLFVIQK